MDERLYWLGLSVFPGIGPATFSSLMGYFGSAKNIWTAKENLLKNIIKRDKLINELVQFRESFSPVKYAKQIKEANASYCITTDNDYPTLLSKISNPPFVLYVKGNINFVNQQSSVGIVGTRLITDYGQDVTIKITEELVASGVCIVSGLAMGVDAVAHRATVDAGGKTIAVLGCGVDCCSPASNQPLYNSILKCGGGIVSEVPLGHAPTRGLFPSRNRIIAGLSLGIVVTQGAADSGALITADYAKKFGRKVFAVPGPITSSLSKGPLKLLKNGAKLVTGGQDIIDDLGLKKSFSLGSTRSKQIKSMQGFSKDEKKVLETLINEPLNFDQIIKKTGLNSSIVGSILTMLEIKGIIKNQESGMFIIVSSE